MCQVALVVKYIIYDFAIVLRFNDNINSQQTKTLRYIMGHLLQFIEQNLSPLVVIYSYLEGMPILSILITACTFVLISRLCASRLILEGSGDTTLKQSKHTYHQENTGRNLQIR